MGTTYNLSNVNLYIICRKWHALVYKITHTHTITKSNVVFETQIYINSAFINEIYLVALV